MLIAIKIAHTVIWAVFAGAILVLPVLAWRRRFRPAVILSCLVWVECAIIVLNRWRCPLTDMAAKFTSNRAPNFDIYLPIWLAEYNKLIFGVLFIASEFMLLFSWLQEKHRAVQ